MMTTVVKRILLAEDDPKDVDLTLRALAKQHLANEVQVARDGAEALDYLFHRGAYAERPDGPPAVVLLDIKMPKVDAIEVLRQIRADTGLHDVPVVILTSSKEDRDLLESYRLGTNAYVVKPVDFRAFTEAVKELGLFWAVINQPPLASAEKCG